MNIHQIYEETQTSKWQPKFKITDDINEVVKMINLGHEDDPINHKATREMIEFYCLSENCSFTLGQALSIQKYLFDKKIKYVQSIRKKYSDYLAADLDDINDSFSDQEDLDFVNNLPNLHIQLGMRNVNVKVGNWVPPSPMFLTDLVQSIFPIQFSNNCELMMDNYGLTAQILMRNEPIYNMELLQQWYKIFQTIHPLNDLNGRVGGIIIAVLGKKIFGKYLTINKK